MSARDPLPRRSSGQPLDQHQQACQPAIRFQGEAVGSRWFPPRPVGLERTMACPPCEVAIQGGLAALQYGQLRHKRPNLNLNPFDLAGPDPMLPGGGSPGPQSGIVEYGQLRHKRLDLNLNPFDDAAPDPLLPGGGSPGPQSGIVEYGQIRHKRPDLNLNPFDLAGPDLLLPGGGSPGPQSGIVEYGQLRHRRPDLNLNPFDLAGPDPLLPGGGSPGPQSGIVEVLKEKLRATLAERDAFAAELEKHRKLTRATRVSELESRIEMLSEECERHRNVQMLMRERMQQAEMAAHAATDHAKRSMDTLRQYMNEGSESVFFWQ
eukprot:gene11728-5206_t